MRLDRELASSAEEMKSPGFGIVKVCHLNKSAEGSGRGSNGKAVVSNSRGPRYESSHRQKSTLNILGELY